MFKDWGTMQVEVHISVTDQLLEVVVLFYASDYQGDSGSGVSTHLCRLRGRLG